LSVEFALQSLTLSGCFFIDSNIILSEILKQNKPRIDKFKRDVDFHGIPCYISESAKRECDTKIETTLNFLGTIIRESIKLALEESRRNRRISITSPISSDDIIALEKSFSTLHGATRAIQLPLFSPIQIVEEWAVAFLGEKLEQGVSIDIRQFLVELVKKLLALTSSIEDPYDELVTFERRFAKKINVVVDASIVDLLDRGMGIHEPNATHIASAISHQTNSNEKTVFVTLDFGSIIRRQDEIKRLLNIVCCDPLYAIYHLM